MKKIEIGSRANPRVTRLLKERNDLFFFEGKKLVADLLSRPVPVEILIQQPEWEGVEADRLSCVKNHWAVSRQVMNKLSDLKTAPEVMAVVRGLEGKIRWPDEGWIAALDSIQDPANLGSIFRCASAFAVSALALTGNCVRPNNPKLVRAAQTSLLDVPFACYPDLLHLIQKAQRHHYSIYLTTPHPGSNPVSIDRIRLPALLVFGGEGRGIPKPMLSIFPTVTIPQRERIESLNVGIAACIAFYELSKKRRP